MPDEKPQFKSRPDEDVRDLALAASKVCPAYHTRRAARAVTLLYDRELARFDVSSPQLTLLSAITSVRRADTDFLSRVLMLDKSALSRNLRVLEREGLIHRESQGKRSFWRLTERGQERTMAALDHWRSVTDRVTAVLPPGRFAQLVEDLERLAHDASAGRTPR